MFAWLRRWWNGGPSDSGNSAASAAERSVAIGRDNINSPITINQSDNTEVLKAISDLTRQVIALNPAQAAPD
jgi:hypothetical protein